MRSNLLNAKIYEIFGLEYKIILVPKLLEGVAENTSSDLMQPDGIHPSEKAQSKLLDNVWKNLKNMVGASEKMN